MTPPSRRTPSLLRPLALTLAVTALAVPTSLALGAAPASADVCIPIPGVPCIPLPGGPTATTPTTITGSPRVDLTLTATAPVWSDANAVTTYQWQRDGAAIVGATGSTYTVAIADIGAQLTVVATGTVLLSSGTTTSEPVLGLIGPPATATRKPSVTGTPRASHELTATPGTWAGSPTPTFSYQWYRASGGSVGKLLGADDPTYVVKTGDAGSVLAVVVTADRPGHESGAAVGTATIARRASTTALAAATATVSAAKRAVVKVTLRSDGGTPTGVVRIYDAGTLLTKVDVGARAQGVVRVTLPRLAAGRHPLTATYAGTTTTAPSTSKKLTLTVTR